MIALDFEGQMLIDVEKIQRSYNLEHSIFLIRSVLEDIRNENISAAKEKIITAHELVFRSMHTTLIVVRGLQAKVINEEQYLKKYTKLDEINKKLYKIYSDLHKLVSQNKPAINVVNYRYFQLHKIKRTLSGLLSELAYTH